MDEDNCLRGFKDRCNRIEQVGWDQLAKHERPSRGDVTGFETGYQSAVRDLDDKHDHGKDSQFGRQRPLDGLAVVKAVFVPKSCPQGEAEEG